MTDTDELAYALTYLADITELPASPATLPQAAAYYASLGWPVLPLEAGGKRPIGGLAPNGLHDATTDLGTIEKWWTAMPTANIGLRTGIAFDVVDLDTKNGKDGLHSFWQLCDQTSSRPHLLGSTVTPTGGRHLLVGPTGKGNLSNVAAGVDYRGAGGYIVAPPSVIDGRPYTWIVNPKLTPEASA